jgi:hypothetical protein
MAIQASHSTEEGHLRSHLGIFQKGSKLIRWSAFKLPGVNMGGAGHYVYTAVWVAGERSPQSGWMSCALSAVVHSKVKDAQTPKPLKTKCSIEVFENWYWCLGVSTVKYSGQQRFCTHHSEFHSPLWRSNFIGHSDVTTPLSPSLRSTLPEHMYSRYRSRAVQIRRGAHREIRGAIDSVPRCGEREFIYIRFFGLAKKLIQNRQSDLASKDELFGHCNTLCNIKNVGYRDDDDVGKFKISKGTCKGSSHMLTKPSNLSGPARAGVLPHRSSPSPRF